MKYLKPELCEKACFYDEYEAEWNERNRLFLEEFQTILSRLPKRFIQEFNKYHFHDNELRKMYIEKKLLTREYKYFLYMDLIDYRDSSVHHLLTFEDIKNLKTDLVLSDGGNSDWIYCEILPVNNKYLSLEVFLFGDSSMYFEFTKLRYKKIKT